MIIKILSFFAKILLTYPWNIAKALNKPKGMT